ncbi:hypothetical protein SOPP22_16725 [Shewanella sp. OPT22]|nr:hypothetical protein SOPP22_16725 [Shewanella sp. OPT22]
MYFWNIKQLKEDLTKGKLSEKENLKYLITYVITTGLSTLTLGETNQVDLIMSALLSALTVGGLIYLYQLNGGDNGTNFLSKYFSLGWVLILRFAVVVLPLSFAFAFISTIFLGRTLEETDYWDMAFTSVLLLVYIWRLGFHIKETSEQNA